jgi:lycopene cyclase domain-containing protein
VSRLLYVGLLLGCLLGTAPLEIVLRTRVYARWRRLLVALGPVVIVYGGWDLWAIHRHQWSYDKRWLVGWILPGGLPIEELLFFIVIPICAVLTLEAVRRRRPDWLVGDELVGDERVADEQP